jgi:Fur family transcriptional regulator, ferric uptake regulator
MSCYETLQERGYRLTPQRLMVLEAVHGTDKHISADEIFAQLKARYPYANVSTVYRTLELLTELGLVTKTDLGGDCARYHHREKGHHHHLICKQCGQVIDIKESALLPLRESILKNNGFQADLSHLVLSGLCAQCRS